MASNVLAQGAAWTPKLDFVLDGANYSETLAWLSGWSYALTEVNRKQAVNWREVESKTLVDALNTRFKGQTVTPEQAAPVLLAAAQAKHCRPK